MLCFWASSPAFAAATDHLTLAASLWTYWFYFSTSALLKSLLGFPWRCMFWPPCLKGFSLNLYFSESGTSSLEVSPHIPSASLCTAFAPGALVPCCAYCRLQLLPSHFCFLDQTELPGWRNSVILFPCLQYPEQYFGPSGIELQEMSLQSHDDGFHGSWWESMKGGEANLVVWKGKSWEVFQLVLSSCISGLGLRAYLLLVSHPLSLPTGLRVLDEPVSLPYLCHLVPKWSG